ncbi:MAG: molybdate ABC transporter substrate-binding protein [Corynebacterium sp.]|uniref:molybdate ABC transporter substrate-binding protein n=1 Tax=Corynebacterium sp. TaxID=1720 RepID=UPI0026DF8EF5|nr:molybdate ABC transporter substrate-binding protein [Corynebacterium sp.]MDO5670479.1 molybdate ABC transporter substrate-binding protein [Corynebacterium sp.]
MRIAAALAAACLLSACGTTDDLTVLGAASTRVLNESLAEKSPTSLEFINAGSSTLVQQLAEGSPGDVLITADQATMDAAIAQGLVEDPHVVATNTMVMVVPQGNPAGIRGVEDLGPDTALVLCDEQVPCGAISHQLIDAANWDVHPVSLEHAVSDVLGKVVSGEADAGWVYRSDAAAAGEAVEVIELPGAADHPNSLVAAVTTSAAVEEEARAFVELLRSVEMRPVWAEHGFTPAR